MGGFPRTPVLSRLMPRVEYELNTGCWLWAGGLDGQGYGRIGIGRKCFATHRITYAEFKGDPTGLNVCHKCDTPACCNPDHLFLGTQADNLADMSAKGRHGHGDLRGDAHPNSLLTRGAVEAIRRLAANSNLTQTEIGARYGVTQTCVSDVVTRRSWRHVP